MIKKRITILGGAGLIGRALNTALEKIEVEVFKPDIRDSSLKNENLGAVINCIGITNDFVSRKNELIESHVMVVENILNHARFDSFLNLSSTRVYEGAVTSNEQSDVAVNPHGISNFYNLSKLLSESLVLNHPFLTARVVRLSYAIDDVFFGGNDPISLILKNGTNGRINIAEHPESEKDYVFLSQAVEILIQIALHGEDRIYNVASGVNTSFSQLRTFANEYLDLEIVFDGQSKARKPPVIDNRKIRREFHFVPYQIQELFKLYAGGNRDVDERIQ
jgi:nucleoside-diphosphate-sugar epimerase